MVKSVYIKSLNLVKQNSMKTQRGRCEGLTRGLWYVLKRRFCTDFELEYTLVREKCFEKPQDI